MSDPLLEFPDFVAAGLPLIKARDTNSWALGDLLVQAVQTLDIQPGRPRDPDALTLGDLASAWDVDTRRVSEWLAVARFYPLNLRTFGDCRWRHYNLARRAADGDLETACDYLQKAVELHFGVRAFERWLNGVYWEGPVARHELPDKIQLALPGEADVWVTVRKWQA